MAQQNLLSPNTRQINSGLAQTTGLLRDQAIKLSELEKEGTRLLEPPESPELVPLELSKDALDDLASKKKGTKKEIRKKRKLELPTF